MKSSVNAEDGDMGKERRRDMPESTITIHANGSQRTVQTSGTLKVLERLNPYEFRVEVAIMREGVNNNRWDYRNLEDHYKTFIGQPILIAYVGNKIGDGHNMREEIAPDGGRVYTFIDGTAERIIGVLSSKEEDFKLEERDGHLWVVAQGKIFTFYAREAVEKIIATGAMDVSAETDVFEEEESPEGIAIFTDWAGLGVTILGDDVPPAIPGAHIRQLSQLREDIEGMELRAASLIQQEEAEKPVTKQKGVKTTMNKRELAQLQTKFDGYTVLSVSEDGKRVALLRKSDYAFCGYEFADDGVVVPERIHALHAMTTLVFSEDQNVEMDAAVAIDGLAADAIRMNSEIEAKDKRIQELESEVATMRENERVRRIDAAKAAVNSKFSALNAVREVPFDNALCNKIVEMCGDGRFNEIVDNEGHWCGDKVAVSNLLAVCMEAQNELDVQEAKKKAHVFNAWSGELPESGEHAVGEDAVLAWLDKTEK